MGAGAEAVELAVCGGTVVTPEAVLPADVLVSGGRIAAVVPAAEAGAAAAWGPRLLDASGCLVLPGAVDAHVHFREPGFAHKEDWAHGSLAAVAGGVTTVLDMPNVRPATCSAEALEAKVALIAGRSRCHYGLYAGLAAGSLDALEAVARAGAIGFKAFLGETTAALPAPDDGELLEALGRIGAAGLRTMVHAENGALLRRAAARLQAEAPVGLDWHGRSRPAIAEVEAVSRVCLLAAAAGAPVGLAHLSTAQAVDVVRRWKADGLDVRAEACPHHLLLTAAEAAPLGAWAKVNPPLRGAADVAGLWQGIADGTVDTVGSDHAPHTPEEKEAGGRMDRAAAGFAGVQYTVGLLLAEVAAGRLALRRLVELCCEAPARAWGLWPRKGRLAPGADADLALWRLGPAPPPGRCWSLHGESPLLRLRRPGAELVATVVDGALAFFRDEPVGTPRGRWLRP